MGEPPQAARQRTQKHHDCSRSPTVSVVDGDRVNVTFRQRYRSDIIAASILTKTLVMVKIDGRWLIQQESVGN